MARTRKFPTCHVAKLLKFHHEGFPEFDPGELLRRLPKLTTTISQLHKSLSIGILPTCPSITSRLTKDSEDRR
ncbi:MAG: hypothetical protein WB696_32065 [Chthoniobacterales bacterium]